jgi:hypothetical protein
MTPQQPQADTDLEAALSACAAMPPRLVQEVREQIGRMVATGVSWPQAAEELRQLFAALRSGRPESG